MVHVYATTGGPRQSALGVGAYARVADDWRFVTEKRRMPVARAGQPAAVGLDRPAEPTYVSSQVVMAGSIAQLVREQQEQAWAFRLASPQQQTEIGATSSLI